MTEDIKACEHNSLSARDHVDTTYTMHIQSPDTLSVAVSLFLCSSCLELVVKKCVVPRSYLKDGSIDPEMAKKAGEQLIEQKIQDGIKLGESNGQRN